MLCGPPFWVMRPTFRLVRNTACLCCVWGELSLPVCPSSLCPPPPPHSCYCSLTQAVFCLLPCPPFYERKIQFKPFSYSNRPAGNCAPEFILWVWDRWVKLTASEWMWWWSDVIAVYAICFLWQDTSVYSLGPCSPVNSYRWKLQSDVTLAWTQQPIRDDNSYIRTSRISFWSSHLCVSFSSYNSPEIWFGTVPYHLRPGFLKN